MQEDSKNSLIHERILRDISGGILYIRRGRIRFINPAAEEIFGINNESLLGQPFVSAFLKYEENDAFTQVVLDAIYDESIMHESIVPFFNGHELLHLHLRTSFLRDGEEKLGIIIVVDDVTELLQLRGVALDLEKIKELNQQLEIRNQQLRLSRDNYKSQAETDKLTKLFNKAAMERMCKEYLEQLEENKSAAFYVIDLDHFKEANDTYGHQCGDIILEKFASVLRKIFKSTDYVGRFGGDEFVVLIKDIANEDIIAKSARKILKAARSISVEGKDIYITASIGIAIAPKHASTYIDVFNVADKSVYTVKSQGRDGYSINSSDTIH